MLTITNHPMRPKWTDRQIIAASDLTAEQEWADAQLNQLRRLALGWGVVAGFEISDAGGDLEIKPGYGITPLGHEIMLNTSIKFDAEELYKIVVARCCKDWGGSCDLPGGDTNGPFHKTVWLVLRPEYYEACPRAGVAEGCEHPGNALFMSRQGTGLAVDIVCDLDAAYLDSDPDCEALQRLLKGQPVPMPELGEMQSLLPVVAVTVFKGSGVEVSQRGRKRLLPLSVLQGLIACCDCREKQPEPEPEPAPDVVVSAWDIPLEAKLAELMAEFTGFVPRGKAGWTMTVAAVMKANIGVIAGPRFEKAEILSLQGLVAAALVSDDKGLKKWAAGDFAAVVADAMQRRLSLGAGLRPSPGGGTIRAKLEDMTVGDLVSAPKSNFSIVGEKLGSLTGGVFIKTSPRDYLGETDTLTHGGAAAAAWMCQRLTTITSP